MACEKCSAEIPPKLLPLLEEVVLHLDYFSAIDFKPANETHAELAVRVREVIAALAQTPSPTTEGSEDRGT